MTKGNIIELARLKVLEKKVSFYIYEYRSIN